MTTRRYKVTAGDKESYGMFTTHHPTLRKAFKMCVQRKFEGWKEVHLYKGVHKMDLEEVAARCTKYTVRAK